MDDEAGSGEGGEGGGDGRGRGEWTEGSFLGGKGNGQTALDTRGLGAEGLSACWLDRLCVTVVCLKEGTM